MSLISSVGPSGPVPQPDSTLPGQYAIGSAFPTDRGIVAFKIEKAPESLHELLDTMAKAKSANTNNKKFTRFDLGTTETHVLGNGVVALKFADGQEFMGLDAFIREAAARNLLAPGAQITVRIDLNQIKGKEEAVQNWVGNVAKATGRAISVGGQ